MMTSKKAGSTLAQNQASTSKKKDSAGFKVPRKKDNENGHAIGEVNEYDHNNNRKFFKKGPWTAEEDTLLIDYVKKQGERHWNCVQKTGLMRCGKSCRLRWTNHLRPDLKKGAFSPEEESIVLDLHAKLGNKWSKIAAELPGRTDNEIKNFWNTKIKRRMKADQLILNSQGSHSKEGFTFHQHRQNQKVHRTHGQQESLSISNSMRDMHTSVTSFMTTTNLSPMSHSILRGQYPEKPGENSIRSTQFNDPILSFLNNPTYKYQFLSEEEKGSCDVGGSLPLPLISPISRFELSQNFSMGNTSFPIHSHAHSISLDTGSTNMIFAGSFICPPQSTINNTQCESPLIRVSIDSNLSNLTPVNSQVDTNGMSKSIYGKVEQPPSQINYQQIPTFKMLGVDCGANDSWLSSLMRKNSDIENSSITEEEKYTLEGNTACGQVREIETISIGKKRIMDNHNPAIYNSIKKLKVEPLDELMEDDDLSSLLNDFSSISSPTHLYYANSEASIAHAKGEFKLPLAATITGELLVNTIAPSTTTTSEYNNDMDDYCLTNPNENTLNC